MNAGERPPGPPPPGLVGLLRFMRAMNRDAFGTMRARFEAHGDLYFTVSRGDPLFVSRHPDHFEEVLVTHGADFDKRSLDLERVLGQGLLTANGSTWRRHRRLVQPGFRRERLAGYASTMVAAADALAERWRSEPRRDVGRDMMGLTLDIVGKTLFDYDPGEDVEAIGAAMAVLQRSVLTLVPSWAPTPGQMRARRALATLDALIARLVAWRRTRGPAADLLGELLERGELSERELRDELVTLVLAGHETTALALTWTWHLLAQNPEQADRLHVEVDRVLGGRAPTFEDLEALEVTGRIVKEALRLYPPAYAVARVARSDTTIGGYAVPAGSEVVLWIYWSHHDPRWFPDPEVFDPDRFLSGSHRVRHPFGYLPFGAGQRTCIGKHFALAEASLVLARLAQTFTLESETLDPGLDPRITLGPRRAVRMRARARDSAGV